MQIKVHPLFFALALLMIAFGQAALFGWTLLALILHEVAHALAAGVRGFVVKRITLFPFGAMMSVDERFDPTSSIAIGLAGPVCNLFCALLTAGIWWLFPQAYPYTIAFFYANLSLGIFNLLPVYPLDGGRIVLGASKNKLKTIKGLQAAGVALSLIFFALFIASIFYGINFSLGIIAVFLFYAAAFGSKEEMYVNALDSASKNYLLGVEKKYIRISSHASIAKLYHHISSRSDVVFCVMFDDGSVCELDEPRLKEIAIKNKLSSPIGDCLKHSKSFSEKSEARNSIEGGSDDFEKK